MQPVYHGYFNHVSIMYAILMVATLIKLNSFATYQELPLHLHASCVDRDKRWADKTIYDISLSDVRHDLSVACCLEAPINFVPRSNTLFPVLVFFSSCSYCHFPVSKLQLWSVMIGIHLRPCWMRLTTT
jgi:hypothetical protein